jgi:hypothetical protein
MNQTIVSVDDAVQALILARDFAEILGYQANDMRDMPQAFKDFVILREGFEEGLQNRKSEEEQFRQGLL